MVKNIKENGEYDLLKKIEKSPQLTNYVIRNRVSDVKKTAVIATLIIAFVAFICGFMVGLNLFDISQPKNIVEVKVSKD